jgi:predicted ArsR family transcriptional regulator
MLPTSEAAIYGGCGWYRQLFETLLEQPVEVDLLASIVQGDERCRFLIRCGAP